MKVRFVLSMGNVKGIEKMTDKRLVHEWSRVYTVSIPTAEKGNVLVILRQDRFVEHNVHPH